MFDKLLEKINTADEVESERVETEEVSVREARTPSVIDKLEDEHQDLELEILQNQRGSYDVYIFGKITWRNVPSLKVLKDLLKKRSEETEEVN
jgi:hypothetical protein